MKTVLPVAEPIADAYSHIGMEFSMFLTDEKYYPWIINNFIQIYTLKDMQTIEERGGTLDFFYNRYGDWLMYHFTANPYLDYEKVAYSTLRILLKYMTITKIIENAINENKYIFMPVDMYEIQLYSAYMNRHRVHDLFIIGYDSDQRVFYAYDNFKGGQYRLEEVSYDEVSKGYDTLVSDEAVSGWSEIGGICFYRFAQKPWHQDKDELYKVNLQTILSGIREYLMLPGGCDSYSHISCYRYGIDCYTELVNWLKFGINSDDCYVDHRAFSAMRDHKKVMIFRLEYLQKYLTVDLSEFIDSYTKIKESLDIVVNKILKGNISKKASIFESCIQTIDGIKKTEIKTLSKFIERPIQ